MSELGAHWLAAVKSLGRHKGRKYNLGALLRDCKVNSVSLDGNTLVLPFTNKANLERMQEEMEDPSSRNRVTEAVANSFGAAYEFRLTLANGNGASGNNKTAQQSSLVRAALGMGAEYYKRSKNEPQHDAASSKAVGPATKDSGRAGNAARRG